MPTIDLLFGYIIFGASAVGFTYILIWMFLIPFSSPDSFVRLLFPHQSYVVLIGSVSFALMILILGCFAIVLFMYHRFKGKCLFNGGRFDEYYHEKSH